MDIIKKVILQKTYNTRLLTLQLVLGLIMSKNPAYKKFYQNYWFFAFSLSQLMPYIVENETATLPSYRKFLMNLVLDKECRTNKMMLDEAKDCSILHVKEDSCNKAGVKTFAHTFKVLARLYLELNMVTMILSICNQLYNKQPINLNISRTAISTFRSTLFLSSIVTLIKFTTCYVLNKKMKPTKPIISLGILLSSPIYFIESVPRRNLINNLMLEYSGDMLLDMAKMPVTSKIYYGIIAVCIGMYLRDKKFGDLAKALIF